MPTYEYECKSCNYTFEKFQSMKDEPLKDCPQCGKSVRRLINGGSGIIFKGSGFYVTDKSKSSSAALVKSSKKEPDAGESSKSSQSQAASSAGEKGGSDSGAAASSAKNAASKTAKT